MVFPVSYNIYAIFPFLDGCFFFKAVCCFSVLFDFLSQETLHRGTVLVLFSGLCPAVSFSSFLEGLVSFSLTLNCLLNSFIFTFEHTGAGGLGASGPRGPPQRLRGSSPAARLSREKGLLHQVLRGA